MNIALFRRPDPISEMLNAAIQAALTDEELSRELDMPLRTHSERATDKRNALIADEEAEIASNEAEKQRLQDALATATTKVGTLISELEADTAERRRAIAVYLGTQEMAPARRKREAVNG